MPNLCFVEDRTFKGSYLNQQMSRDNLSADLRIFLSYRFSFKRQSACLFKHRNRTLYCSKKKQRIMVKDGIIEKTTVLVRFVFFIRNYLLKLRLKNHMVMFAFVIHSSKYCWMSHLNDSFPLVFLWCVLFHSNELCVEIRNEITHVHIRGNSM